MQGASAHHRRTSCCSGMALGPPKFLRDERNKRIIIFIVARDVIISCPLSTSRAAPVPGGPALSHFVPHTRRRCVVLLGSHNNNMTCATWWHGCCAFRSVRRRLQREDRECDDYIIHVCPRSLLFILLPSPPPSQRIL